MAEHVRILILGTGTVGASIGLALRRAGPHFERIGFDPQSPMAEQAHKSGAIDRTASNPAKAAGDADLVILSLGPSQASEAVRAIAPRLRSETVVLSTSRLPAAIMAEHHTLLGPSNPSLGTVPFLGPQRALSPGDLGPASSADAFDGGMLGIVAPAGTPQGAIEIALDLASILHATPFFLDPLELDSATATSDELPAVLAAALLESLNANPGWRDQRRLVGPAFARLAALLDGDPSDVAAEWIANRDPLLARMDALAEELSDLRDLVAAADEKTLVARLASAAAHHQEWRAYRAASRPDYGVEFAEPPRVGAFDRLLGSGRSKKRS